MTTAPPTAAAALARAMTEDESVTVSSHRGGVAGECTNAAPTPTLFVINVGVLGRVLVALSAMCFKTLTGVEGGRCPPSADVDSMRDRLKVGGIYACAVWTSNTTWACFVEAVTNVVDLRQRRNWSARSFVSPAVSEHSGTARLKEPAIAIITRRAVKPTGSSLRYVSPEAFFFRRPNASYWARIIVAMPLKTKSMFGANTARSSLRIAIDNGANCHE